jgi:hypothetical protein
MNRTRRTLLAFGALVASCAQPSVASHSDAGPGDAGPFFTVSPCPAAPPDAGTACSSPVPGSLLGCEYGGDEWGNCATFAICIPPATDGDYGVPAGWFLLPSQAFAGEPDAGCVLNPPTCPPSFEPDGGAGCAEPGAVCEYGSAGECLFQRWDLFLSGLEQLRRRLPGAASQAGVDVQHRGPAVRLRCVLWRQPIRRDSDGVRRWPVGAVDSGVSLRRAGAVVGVTACA